MKLGKSKSQQEEANGTECKWALLSLAALSHTFFFNSHFLLFCPFCTHSQEFQQTRTGVTVQTRTLPRHVSATHLSRASVLYCRWETTQQEELNRHRRVRHKNSIYAPEQAFDQPKRSACTWLCWDTSLTASLASIFNDILQMWKEQEKPAESVLLYRIEALCFVCEHRLFIICIICYLSPWHLDALLANFSNAYFIISICNCIFRHFFHFLQTYI